jgi:hypothetical protein
MSLTNDMLRDTKEQLAVVLVQNMLDQGARVMKGVLGVTNTGCGCDS